MVVGGAGRFGVSLWGGRGRVVLSVVVAAVLACAAESAVAAGVPTVAPSTSSLTPVGKWNVTYGAPAVVRIKRTSAHHYKMTAVTPVRITGGSCSLPKGTVIAKFHGKAGSYTGRHGLWYPTTCAFAYYTSLTMTQKSGSKIVEHLGNGEVHTLTRVS